MELTKKDLAIIRGEMRCNTRIDLAPDDESVNKSQKLKIEHSKMVAQMISTSKKKRDF